MASGLSKDTMCAEMNVQHTQSLLETMSDFEEQG